MKVIYETPIQVSKASRGNEKFWVGKVVTQAGDYYTCSESWQIIDSGEESKHNNSVPKKILGKNLGRANETLPKDQAILEINSDLQKKQDSGYHNVGEKESKKNPLPMLAHKYKDRSHNLVWPAYIQPKLDGSRMLFDGKVGWSRKGKPIKEGICSQFSMKLPKDMLALDGELMLPVGSGSFQDGMSASKKVGLLTPKLVYYVYDFIPANESLTFEERWEKLEKFLGNYKGKVELVQTIQIKNEKQMNEWHKAWTDTGYEGTMIRNMASPYKVGHRSSDLLKFKDFEDEEFEIVDVLEGEGSEEGCAIFVCTTNGKTFNARPEGTREYRQELFKNAKKLIGQDLTVRYQNLTDEGIPRFPVGVAVRDA